MSLHAPTPPDRLVDAQDRPYFLWDEDLTIGGFRERLRDPDPEVRAYFLGKMMRQANQDAGFSPLTFSWSVKGLPLARLARATGWSDEETASLEAFRDELVDRVVAAAQPQSSSSS